MELERKIARQILMTDFEIEREVEIGVGETGAGRRVDIDLQLDLDHGSRGVWSKSHIQLLADGTVLNQRLADVAVHLAFVEHVGCQTELLQRLANMSMAFSNGRMPVLAGATIGNMDRARIARIPRLVISACRALGALRVTRRQRVYVLAHLL